MSHMGTDSNYSEFPEDCNEKLIKPHMREEYEKKKIFHLKARNYNFYTKYFEKMKLDLPLKCMINEKQGF